MEIKAAPVPSELRFAVQAPAAAVTTNDHGVPWGYVALLCGGSILITIVIFHLRERRRQKRNSFMGFNSRIE